VSLLESLLFVIPNMPENFWTSKNQWYGM